MPKIPIALQMYTVRDDSANDFVGTMRKVAEIGYDGVELAGTGGLSAEDLRDLLDELKLGRAGAHIGVDALGDGYDEAVEYYKTVGTEFLTIPGLPGEMTESGDAWRKTAEILGAGGERLAADGIRLSYHNHAHEFQLFDGEYGLDILYGHTSPNQLHAEIDTYWVAYGGVDPVAYLRKVESRLSLIHIKDMADDPDRSFAEIGNGVLDWDGIYGVANDAGTKWMIVEQDTCPGPALESVRISYENLKKMGRT
jgi:sugar phosphate isomerase/epimerase